MNDGPGHERRNDETACTCSTSWETRWFGLGSPPTAITELFRGPKVLRERRTDHYLGEGTADSFGTVTEDINPKPDLGVKVRNGRFEIKSRQSVVSDPFPLARSWQLEQWTKFSHPLRRSVPPASIRMAGWIAVEKQIDKLILERTTDGWEPSDPARIIGEGGSLECGHIVVDATGAGSDGARRRAGDIDRPGNLEFWTVAIDCWCTGGSVEELAEAFGPLVAPHSCLNAGYPSFLGLARGGLVVDDRFPSEIVSATDRRPR